MIQFNFLLRAQAEKRCNRDYYNCPLAGTQSQGGSTPTAHPDDLVFSSPFSSNQLKFKQCYCRKQYCPPLVCLGNVPSCKSTRTPGPWRSLSLWVALLPREDKLPVMTTPSRGIHIRQNKGGVGGGGGCWRSRGITLKLFILCFLLPSPLSLPVAHFVLPARNKGNCQHPPPSSPPLPFLIPAIESK